jgi:pimeloyl-ACP methyl ester carboxylesterase/DNA-binding CsgD family transcriptional regulator
MASGPEQTIRFTLAGGRTVTWASVGTGPRLVIGGWWMSHLELDWANPAFRAFVTGLAEHRTVVRYDRLGTGLSDRTALPDTSLDGEVEVLARVIEAAAPGPVALLGGSSGGPIAAAYAARHPERVEHLALYGTYAQGSRVAGPDVRQQLISLVSAHWGLGSRVLADLFLPGATAAERDEFARFERASASADVAARSLAAVYAFDVHAELPHVRAPTLVVHRRQDQAISADLGREVAAAIPGAEFVALDGHEHFPWRGDAAAVQRAVLMSIGAPPVGPVVDLAALSDRELEVLRLVARGLADREIARRLSLSPHTIHRHLANIRTKLGLPSRAAAAAHASRAGLI